MGVSEIAAGPDDLLKLRERVAPLGHAGLIGRQVAGDDEGTRSVWIQASRAEDRAATQVDGRIELLRLAEIRVKARKEVEVRGSAAVVAGIAVAPDVDQVAAQSHQVVGFAVQIQWDRGDREANLNFAGFR